MKKLLLLLFIAIFSTSCWRRQCPVKACKVKYEHKHGGSEFRGRGTFPRIHFFGTKKKSKS